MYSQIQDLYSPLAVRPWLAILVFFVLYHCMRAIYLIDFSPLSNFPRLKMGGSGRVVRGSSHSGDIDDPSEADEHLVGRHTGILGSNPGTRDRHWSNWRKGTRD